PGRGERCIEVVDVEEEHGFGRRKAPKVHQVAIAAGLSPDAGVRRPRKIPGHHRRRTTQEGKCRAEHTRIPDRDQIRQSRCVRLNEDIDRVGPVLGRFPSRVTFPRYPLAQRFPLLPPLLPWQELVAEPVSKRRTRSDCWPHGFGEFDHILRPRMATVLYTSPWLLA